MTNSIYNCFLSNKYSNIYFSIINNAKTKIYNCYTEVHHILPKSLGGDNSQSNLVTLSAREHFICHYLLTKMTERDNQFKMLKAFMLMRANSKNQKRYFNSKLYQSAKAKFSKFQSKNVKGKNNPNFGKTYVSNWETKTCIKIDISELQTYLDNGWFKHQINDFSKYTIHNGKIMTINLYESKYKPKNKTELSILFNKKKQMIADFFLISISDLTEDHVIFYKETLHNYIWIYNKTPSEIMLCLHPNVKIHPNDHFRSLSILTRNSKESGKLQSIKINNGTWY